MSDSDVAMMERAAPTNGQPVDPIMFAIEKGMDADSIGKLVALLEGRERQAAERAFTEAISDVSAKAGVIIKSKSGPKAKYAPLDQVNFVLTPLYTAAGLSLSFSEADCPFADKGWKRHVCDVRHKLGHKERYHVDLPLDNADSKNPGMTPIQGAISTGSYAQRVLLCRIFNLTIALTDLDGDTGPQSVTEEQIKEIKALISEYPITGQDVDMEAFFRWLGVDSFEAMTPKHFEKARADLSVKIHTAKRKAGAKP